IPSVCPAVISNGHVVLLHGGNELFHAHGRSIDKEDLDPSHHHHICHPLLQIVDQASEMFLAFSRSLDIDIAIIASTQVYGVSERFFLPLLTCHDDHSCSGPLSSSSCSTATGIERRR